MSILHTNADLPIWLGSGSESTVRLAAELCDGLLPLSFVPGRMARFKPWIEEGFRRAGNGKSWENFEIQARGPVVITDDISAALQQSKPQIALYVGGMGHPTINFHNIQMRQRGFPEAAERIQELFLAGRKQEAIDAVPDEFVDEAGLYGTPRRITARWKAWEESGITGFTVSADQDDALRLMSGLATRQ
jgi:alkanesulfonate monooxygenase SsuD/methylene tetrahydromethanopterin reductase-like flavin-dependent oxidoreductase (luciferase family)